ncbi:blast:Neurogenic locus protein delta [Drosophila guanche]|uniref:Blast:Neurogenic locus protein delta n=1 Tax=Drosophila guanche TaxID=7266 RepID=A0A3B0JU17_DROGU|nr:blast:Neurogenic locus protein delta [Drosophila guanche]
MSLPNKQAVGLSTMVLLALLLPVAPQHQMEDKHNQPNARYNMEQKFSLPAVPLPPPPPPFSAAKHNFSLNAFAGDHQHQHQHPLAGTATGNGSSAGCGGLLKARSGIIQTPSFPLRFATPIECVWIIDASDLAVSQGKENVSIVVYLTQLYVLSGLKLTEFMYYSDDFRVPAHRVFTLTEDEVTQVSWVQFHSPYLEIRFTMATLDGTHLRALDRLLDVYGFNITYEVQHEVKQTQCNTLQCRFLGNCYASADYGSYGCACFPGFSGSDCGHGPLCQDIHTNVCQNGGTCKLHY